MENTRILWADDEIDLLKPHVMFLENKGFTVTTVTNGEDAIDAFKEEIFDIVFLDENMPGLNGLQTLNLIKRVNPTIPVVMITKSEAENIMEEAIGSKIADYLIKPVNPNQILLTIKKNLQQRKIRTQKVTSDYQSAFSQLGIEINDSFSWEDWATVYEKLIYWELELEGADNTMDEVLKMQKQEANNAFTKFIKRNYIDWLHGQRDERPLLSQDIFKEKVFPILDNDEKVFVIVFDNFRYDQWKAISPLLADYFHIETEEMYYSILPTATQYARNAIFSGLMPLQIKELYPQFWVDEDEEDNKNIFEEQLIQTQLDRFRKPYNYSFHKIFDSVAGSKLIGQLPNICQNPLNVIVYNFIDMMSHARTEVKMMKELAQDEAAYRSLALSWFTHSSTFDLFKELAEKNVKIILTTDHGATRISNPVKVVGDKQTNTNLRYKTGKNLNYNYKKVFEIRKPEEAFLPTLNMSSKYIIAYENDFFAYPNNYNHYVNYYKDTFQHGGISLEEMLIPLITLSPKTKK